MEDHSILTILEKRLEGTEYSGFSHQTLSKRKELLVESSRMLLKNNKEEGHERMIRGMEVGSEKRELDVTPGNQIAGLLLLLETGEAEECLSLAYIEYEEWKSRVGDFGICYQDLLLVIDYATLEFARNLKDKRFFESAATVIEQRLLKEEMGFSSTELKDRMRNELERLLPYRILDLISRESSDIGHKFGIERLKYLVTQRGGIDKDSNRYIGNEEFKAFFRQVRVYLTVQEQIDLFQDWAHSGSKVGAFLAGIALVASGFVQRKPEKIVEAVQMMERIQSDELQPIVANMYLLLGDVKSAEERFEKYSDNELKDWTQNHSDETLGRICGWCREWLLRDVLTGYKDIDAEANLEAYFGDKDVIDYLESIEKLSGVSSCELRMTKEKKGFTRSMNDQGENSLLGWENGGLLDKRMGKMKNKWLSVASRLKPKERDKKFFNALIMGSVATGLLLISSKWIGDKQGGTLESAQKGKDIKEEDKERRNRWSDIGTIYRVLARYHSIKREVLAGGSLPSDAKDYLSEKTIERLLYEREIDRRRGEKQVIDVKIKEVSIKEKGEKNLTVKAVLYYKDKKIDNKGDVVTKTAGHVFERIYTLINKRNRWLVD